MIETFGSVDRDLYIGAESDIHIDENGEVVFIDFSNCKFKGHLCEEIGDLTSITHLDLSCNILFGSIPDTIGKLTKLKMLDVSYNELSGCIPDTIGKLRNLTELYMGMNELEGRIPYSIGTLNQLTYFTLIGNKGIEGPIPENLHPKPIKDGATELACNLQIIELKKIIEKKEVELKKIKRLQKIADDTRAENRRKRLDGKENSLRARIHDKEVLLKEIYSAKHSLTSEWEDENVNIVSELQLMVTERPLTKEEREKKANVEFLASRVKNLPQFPINRKTVIEEIQEMIQHSKDEEQIQEASDLIKQLSDTTAPLRQYSEMSKAISAIFYITGNISGRHAENVAFEIGKKISKLRTHPGFREDIITSVEALVKRSKNSEQKKKAMELCVRIKGK